MARATPGVDTWRMPPRLQLPFRKHSAGQAKVAEDPRIVEERQREERMAEQMRFLRAQEAARAGTSVAPPGHGPPAGQLNGPAAGQTTPRAWSDGSQSAPPPWSPNPDRGTSQAPPSLA